MFLMKPQLSILLSVLCLSLISDAQTCSTTEDLGSTAANFSFNTYAGSDIVRNNSTENTRTQSFDIWNDNGTSTTSCTVNGGNNDVTFEFTSNTGENPYGTTPNKSYTATEIDIQQSTSGLKSSIQFDNSSSSYQSYPGDVRSQQVKVTFASHVDINASDFDIKYTSGNTRATSFESTTIIFLNASGIAYNTPVYDGYYGSDGTPKIVTCGTAGNSAGTVFSSKGNGSFTAASTVTVSATSNNCTVLSGSNGSDNTKTVNAQTDAGLNATEKIGGFIWIVRLEDIAGAASATTITSTSSSPSATLNSFTISSLPVPVKLISFEAYRHQDLVKLNWQTASELNNSHFEIEKSINGRDFSLLDVVDGNSTSNEINSYEYFDIGNQSTVHYRLKQVDFDGAFEYSDVVKVKTAETISDFTLSPNPATSQVNLKGDLELVTSITIISLQGMLVETIERPSHQLNLDLPEGMYYVRLNTEHRTVKSLPLVIN